MELESVTDDLYGQPPDLFVERRTERVAQARADRDRALAKAIGQLRRPTRSAWLVNLLVRESPEDVAAFLDLGAALIEAQRRLSGPDLRKLSSQRQAAVSALTRRARDLAAERGHTTTEATQQEVSQTLQTALADPSVAELVRSGRVVQAASYGGFGPVPNLPEPAAQPAESPEPSKSAEPDIVRARALEAVERAEATLSSAREQIATAEANVGRAEDRADGLAEEVERLRAALSAAVESAGEARERTRAASTRLDALNQAASDAEQVLTAARRRLEDLPEE